MAKVLIAEDEVSIRVLLSRFFQWEGHEVINACNGREAIILAEETSPDLLILDLEMPEMTGWDVIRTLRSTPHANATPIAVLSSHTTSADRDEAHLAGCDLYLSKPVDLDVLRQVARNLINAVPQ